MEKEKQIILVPALELRNGSGHLVRIIRLHMEIGNSSVFIPSEMQQGLLEQFPLLKECRLTGDLNTAHGSAPLFYVIDMPFIEYSRLMELKALAPVAAIDLGGEGRMYADYLLDSLPYPGTYHHRKYFKDQRSAYPPLPPIPGLSGMSAMSGMSGSREGEASNLYDPGMLRPRPTDGGQTSLTPKIAAEASGNQVRSSASGNLIRVNSVLVSFGGSDPGQLTARFVDLLKEHKFLRSVSGNIIFPRRLSNSILPELPDGWSWMKPVEDLTSRFSGYELMICSYGLSAWEAQFSGLPVLIVDASDYHRRLSLLSGFLSVQPDSLGTAVDQLQYPELARQLVSQVERVCAIPASSLGERVRSIRPQGNSCCPCCGNSGPNPVISRAENRSYSACSRCGTVYLFRVTADSFDYDESYFFSQYKAQYGKTYMEDFQHIQNMGAQRLKYIRKHLSIQNEQPSLLDIGCAYGPFLQAAREDGFSCQGIDISPAAVEYVQNTLQIPAASGDISDPEFRRQYEENAFSVVTMWYVIEHFSELRDILVWIRKILKPGGIFAFSTPSNRGISGRRDLSGFLQNGPEDHFTVWNPRQADELGNMYGLMLAESRSTGHHPERFPAPFSHHWLRGMSMSVSRALDLGDSFEAYFINIPEED